MAVVALARGSRRRARPRARAAVGRHAREAGVRAQRRAGPRPSPPAPRPARRRRAARLDSAHRALRARIPSAARATSSPIVEMELLGARRSGSPRVPCLRRARCLRARRVAIAARDRRAAVGARQVAAGRSTFPCATGDIPPARTPLSTSARIRPGIFGAWVVRREHGQVGAARRRLAHEGTLPRIAIAAAAEHDDQPPASRAAAAPRGSVASASGVWA